MSPPAIDLLSGWRKVRSGPKLRLHAITANGARGRMTTRSIPLLHLVLPLTLLGRPPAADTAGAFVLHKIGNPIGRETWHLSTTSDGGHALSSRFEFSDRGTKVPLEAELQYDHDGRPTGLVLRGRTSRQSSIDLEVVVAGDSARIRRDTVTSTIPLQGGFPAQGYAPIAMQQAVLGAWRKAGRPAALRLVPEARLRIVSRGQDTLDLPSGRAVLERVSVAGLIWGIETVWLDTEGALVAAVTIDAEGDPFQAVRAGDEGAVGRFVSLAAGDAVAALGPPPAADTLLALVGGTLVDGTGAAPVRDAAIVIRGSRIVAAGPRARVKLPRGATVIRTDGATMLPGLWDMHAHYAQVEWGPIYLASGVTTVRDVGNQLEFLLGLRQALAAGRGIGPRVLSAGIIDGDSPNAIGVERAATPAQGIALVRKYHDAGLEQIKIYSSVSDSVLPAITREAHALGMTVTGHVPTGLDGHRGVAAGMDQINHVTFVQRMMRAAGDTTPLTMDLPEARRAIAFLAQRRIVIDPTVALYELLLHPADQPLTAFEPGAATVAPELRSALEHTGVEPSRAAAAAARLRTLLEIVGALHRAGVPIVAGTDMAVPGHSLHRELELYVQAGMTPMAAIQAATLQAARAMGLERESGTLRPGLRADVLVVEGDPLTRIEDTRRVRLVVANGRRHDPAPLWRSVGFTP
jgi:imidazolonepropionase-like amidohydrolase